VWRSPPCAQVGAQMLPTQPRHDCRAAGLPAANGKTRRSAVGIWLVSQRRADADGEQGKGHQRRRRIMAQRSNRSIAGACFCAWLWRPVVVVQSSASFCAINRRSSCTRAWSARRVVFTMPRAFFPVVLEVGGIRPTDQPDRSWAGHQQRFVARACGPAAETNRDAPSPKHVEVALQLADRPVAMKGASCPAAKAQSYSASGSAESNGKTCDVADIDRRA